MTAADRPNIVLIHGHDLGRWLSCYGRPSVPSPNLEAFARESVVFDRAFSTAPLCTPARSSLFTGLTPHANGLMGLAHSGWRYRSGVRTLPEMLGDAGYDTTLIGLQHEHPDPLVLGFEEVGGLGFLPHADAVVDEAVDWLHSRTSTAPYLLTVGVWEAHRPWDLADYPAADPDEVEVPAFLPDNESTRRDLAEFYGAISYLDTHVGRLITALNEREDADNTLVIFTTDHGAALPGAKSTLYDPGIEVALLARPPRSWNTAPRRIEQQVSHLDIVPTLLELAQASIPDALEGTSLSAVLRPDPAPPSADETPRTLFFEKTYHDGYDPIRAVRTEAWKYIRNFADGPRLSLARDLEESLTRQGMGDDHLRPRSARELYDLVADPDERVNVADRPENAERVAAHDRALIDWMKRTGDPLIDGQISPPPRPTRDDG